MFQKIVIANRGEIAVRIMATCREMGIRTVAVYSEADRNARHVRVADEAYAVGPAPAAQSYLRSEAILDVARRSGAEAIHPGYGFLSENAAFAEACEQAGIVFIGPSPAAMRLMGSKIAAKQLAQSVGAPVVPGYIGDNQEEIFLQREAQRVGFPLLIKASAGGGGKGMREVHDEKLFLEALAGAKREALASFGDDAIFLERLIARPRHIEIQVLADRHGNVIHLGERECSIQRRHQKIVEESPSIALTPERRAEMSSAAVRIAKAARYSNAGTIEFIVDEDRQFYFLEMNTRLQVEHPVTESVTGLDLVRHQILIAAGEPLGIEQHQVSFRGHAIEVRLYAEDPQQSYLPSTGVIQRFVEPQGPGIRVDSGVGSGDEISQFYDPMIAKLIVSAEDRPAAIARLRCALEQTAIYGVTTNISLLHGIPEHPAFQEGLTHTGFLRQYGFEETQRDQPLPQEVLLAAACFDLAPEVEEKGHDGLTSKGATAFAVSPLYPGGRMPISPWTSGGPWHMVGEARSFTYRYEGNEHRVALSPLTSAREATWNARIDGEASLTITFSIEQGCLVLLRRGVEQQCLYAQQEKGATLVVYRGQSYRLAHRQPPDVESTALGGHVAQKRQALIAPMAGTIVKVYVQEGEEVQAQQTLIILTAMKMEHAVTAPYNGKIKRIYSREGEAVKGGAVLLEME